MADITPIVPLTGELAMPEKVWMQGPPGPQGPKGDTGAAATVTVGTVTTGEPGADAIVTNSGTESAAVLNFTIPRGATGAAGAAGADGVSPTVSTSKSGNVTTITIVDASGTKTATINDGAKGDTGPAGPAGAGVPDGGTVGQLLSKTESGTAWIDPPQSGVQPDWNQNDSTAADYVKNRPFWMVKTKELAIPDITEPMSVTTADSGYGFFLESENFVVVPDVTNYVLFDGVEYTCEPYYSNEAEGTAIGSYDFSDYPFFISDGLIMTQTAGNHTVLQYCDAYTVHADYAPCLVVHTKKTADGTPYLSMEDVEKIKVAFKNGVPIMLDVAIGSTGFDTRVHNVTNFSIASSGFGESSARGIMRQVEFHFFVHDGSLDYYNVSYSGSITEVGDIYPLMYIKNRKYKITVDNTGTLKATEVK